jgi:hypothetical protein
VLDAERIVRVQVPVVEGVEHLRQPRVRRPIQRLYLRGNNKTWPVKTSGGPRLDHLHRVPLKGLIVRQQQCMPVRHVVDSSSE